LKVIEPPASEVAPESVALSAIAWPTLTVWLTAVTIAGLFLTTSKHSVVVFVWVPDLYWDCASGV
jgi:hypothetical protein